jgi:hypothetical protein
MLRLLALNMPIAVENNALQIKQTNANGCVKKKEFKGNTDR